MTSNNVFIYEMGNYMNTLLLDDIVNKSTINYFLCYIQYMKHTYTFILKITS